MAQTKTAPGGEPVAADFQASVDAAEDTAPASERQALIDLSFLIERDRRIAALHVAKLYQHSPTAAVAARVFLRDLRLLGREIGRLAFAAEVSR